jgi:hypothetical protein
MAAAAAALQELASHWYRSKFVGGEHAAAPFWLLHPLFPFLKSSPPPEQGSSSAVGSGQLAGRRNAAEGAHSWGVL